MIQYINKNSLNTSFSNSTLPSNHYNHLIFSKVDRELLHILGAQFMKHGQLSKSKKLILKSLKNIRALYPNQNPLHIIKKSIYNILPYFEVKSKRFFKSKLESIVLILSKKRRLFIVLRQIKNHIKTLNNPFTLKFTQTIVQLEQKKGPLWSSYSRLKQRVEFNKIYTDFRWK